MKSESANASRSRKKARPQPVEAASKVAPNRQALVRAVAAVSPRKRMWVASKVALTAARVAADAFHHNAVATTADPAKTARSTKKKFNGKYRKRRPNFQ